ncbi:hypothetical protein EYF80_030672 [Liparis tanakae]|uniref:Uncharacterized protein n=1 Tax=Liparis tanakae TaxID=230148 RepID=A0A4Z2GZW0_9TELE|nr:hypothetical protein EYF80_030672 [Liparis tanakae]
MGHFSTESRPPFPAVPLLVPWLSLRSVLEVAMVSASAMRDICSMRSGVAFSALLNIFRSLAALPPALIVRERTRFSGLAVLSLRATISPAMHFTRWDKIALARLIMDLVKDFLGGASEDAGPSSWLCLMAEMIEERLLLMSVSWAIGALGLMGAGGCHWE